jgi:hypothetical protein
MMLDKVRPAGLATADRRYASLKAKKHPPNSQNLKTLQTADCSWLQIGQIATGLVLPKVAAARERDRVVRRQLGLPLTNWSVQP